MSTASPTISLDPRSAPPTALPATLVPCAESVALTSLRPGQLALIREAKLDKDDAALLRAMGICAAATIRVCRVGEPCVIAVGGVGHRGCSCGGTCRVGLARGIAQRIFVSVLA